MARANHERTSVFYLIASTDKEEQSISYCLTQQEPIDQRFFGRQQHIDEKTVAEDTRCSDEGVDNVQWDELWGVVES